MPSTHLSLHYHIVFSTKERRRLIAEPWRAELHAYIGGIVRNVGGVARSVGGTRDHLHALLGLKATHTLADVVRQIKRGSSLWIHQHGVSKFAGRRVTQHSRSVRRNLSKVHRYITNQVDHHRDKTFEEEYVELLRLSGVDFDDRYLW